MRLLLFLLAGVGAWGQIESPRIGVMLDTKGRARPVSGMPAAAIAGDPWFDGAVISLACAEQGCVAKTEAALFTPAGVVVDAPPGAAIIALDPASPGAAYVYFVESGRLARWTGSQLIPLDFARDGDVLSIRAVAGGFEYAVSRDGEVWIGAKSLGPANSVLLLDGGGVLLARGGQVCLLRPDGTETDFAVAGAGGFVGGFLRMSDRYVQVITDAGMWALDVEPGHEQIFLLPGVAH
ncbi:MAG: hypothetical protein ABI833_20785 [Acidobacteriota bacterium]